MKSLTWKLNLKDIVVRHLTFLAVWTVDFVKYGNCYNNKTDNPLNHQSWTSWGISGIANYKDIQFQYKLVYLKTEDCH